MKKELTCTLKDGFWFSSIFLYQGSSMQKEAIIIDQSDTDKFVEYIKNKMIDKVIIDLWNSSIKSLDFLSEINHIKFLKILGDGKIDNSPIYKLNELIFLEYLNPSEFYLDRIISLEFFSTNRVSQIKNINISPKLRTLKLVDYANEFESTDLTFLNGLLNLEVLSLSDFNIISLEGIGNLTNLKIIVIQNMKRLKYIDDLIDLKESLSSVKIQNCKKIENFNIMSQLDQLKHIYIEKIGSISSLDFIIPLKSLKSFFSIDNLIMDGNITPRRDLEVSIILPVNKKYYYDENNEKKQFFQSNLRFNERDYGDKDIEPWRRV